MIRRIVSVLFACVIAAVAVLVWQLSRGPLALDFLTPSLEEALNDADGDWRVAVGELVLMSDLKIHARAVSLLDRQGAPVLQVPDLTVRPSLLGLMHGLAAVGMVEINGAEASVVRRADGTFGVSVQGAPPAATQDPTATRDLVNELLQPANTDYAIGFLHRVRVRDARVSIEDLESGATWSIQNLEIGLVRSAEDQQLTLRAALAAGKDAAPPTTLDAKASLRPSGDGFALQGEATAGPIDVGRLALYWPQNAAAAARRWVTANIPKGNVPEVVVDLAMDSAQGADFRLTRLDGRLRYEGLEVRWSDEAPAVTAVAGTSTFNRSSMHFDVQSGASGGLSIASAKVDLKGLDVDQERLDLTVNGSGPFAAVIHLLPANVTLPLAIEGDTSVRVGAALPLRAGLRFDDVVLNVEAQPSALEVSHAAADGVVSGLLRYRKAANAPAALTADLDVHAAQVHAGAFRWAQPPQSKGKAAFQLRPTVQPLKLDQLRVDCSGLDARGEVVLERGGETGSFHLLDVSYDRTDLDRIEGQWTPSSASVRFGRGTLDLQPFLKDAGAHPGAGGSGTDERPIDLDIRMDGGVRISLDRNSWVENVRATLDRRRGKFQRIDIRADLPRRLWSAGQAPSGNGVKTFWLKLEPSGPGQRLDAAAPDFGALLKAVDVSNGVRGGNLVISGRADTMASGDVVRSHVKVTDFVLAEAPLVVRILTVAALDRFVGTLKGEGLHFDSLKGTVVARGDRYELSDFRAYGSSVGWTASGWVDIGTDELSIDGAVIPAYAANQVVKNVPLLGRIFAGTDKRGLIAINYKVRGALKDPKVTANPLTALTPGILRGLWEIGE
jgi:hypothetical protein